MKKIRRLVGVILIIAALITMQLPGSEASAAAAASDFVVDGVTLTKYNGTAQYVTVPATVEVIAESAFSDNADIVQITLPDSVKKIEPFAFWGCDKLQSVLLGKGITVIDDYAFANCKGLKTMVIPSGVSAIGVCSFMDCVNLVSIYLPDSVRGIHDSAFNGCYKLIIQAPEGSYGSRFAAEFYELQKEMHEYEDVNNYQPDNNTGNTGGTGDTGNNNSGSNTGNSTYVPVYEDPNANTLGSTHVVGNQAVVFIDTDTVNVYSGSTIPAQTVPAESQTKEDGSGQTQTETSDPEQEQEISQPPKIGEVIPKSRIVNGVIVADQAYYRDQDLTNVTVPGGIVEIGEFAYARSAARTVTVPEGVKYIDYGAFYHCDNLKTVRLPDSIENISPKAFQYTGYVLDFLDHITGTGDFLVNGSSLIAYRGTGTEVNVPDGVKVIAGEVFKDHSEIEKVNLPSGLLVIGEGAFETCSNLKEVSFGDSVTDIKDRAFAGCMLTEVSLPDSLLRLGLYAFDDQVTAKFSAAVVNTHEASAERLSNESYRRTTDNGGYGGVTVVGADEEGILARLEGAQRRYTLRISNNSNTADFLTVYRNTMGKEFPADCPIYEMNFTDSSGIPITRLGKQLLYVTIPLSEEFQGVKANVLTLDRNGQLEYAASERVVMNGKDCIRIAASHLSHFGIVKTEESLSTENVITLNDSIRQNAAPAENIRPTGFVVDRIKFLAAAVFFLAGVILIFRSTKFFVK